MMNPHILAGDVKTVRVKGRHISQIMIVSIIDAGVHGSVAYFQLKYVIKGARPVWAVLEKEFFNQQERRVGDLHGIRQ